MATEPSVGELFDLRGRAVVVTGASGWLGGALARALAEAGADVVATSRDAARARRCAAALPGPGKHAGIAWDHRDPDSLARGFAAAVEAAGRVDVLVTNAHEHFPRDWRDATAADFAGQFENGTGAFLLARHLRDHAVERGVEASVILMGSMYGVVGSYPDAYAGIGPASAASYHALKGAIVHLTRHLAVYWAKDRVRVNCLSPGPFPASAAPRELVARLEARSPIGRMGEPWELKGAVVFLASRASSYVTGHNLVVDGGWTAW